MDFYSDAPFYGCCCEATGFTAFLLCKNASHLIFNAVATELRYLCRYFATPAKSSLRRIIAKVGAVFVRETNRQAIADCERTKSVHNKARIRRISQSQASKKPLNAKQVKKTSRI